MGALILCKLTEEVTIMNSVIALFALVAAVSASGGGYSYNGRYAGKCGNDGFYYNDANSFVICSNGNAYYQPCAPGSKNKGHSHYTHGGKYGVADFCGVNLVDYGYGAHKGGYGHSHGHSAGYGTHGHNAGYGSRGHRSYGHAAVSHGSYGQTAGYGTHGHNAGYGTHGHSAGYGTRGHSHGHSGYGANRYTNVGGQATRGAYNANNSGYGNSHGHSHGHRGHRGA